MSFMLSSVYDSTDSNSCVEGYSNGYNLEVNQEIGYKWYQSQVSSDMVHMNSMCSCGCQFSISQNQVYNPTLYYLHEYRPPPAPPHLFHCSEPPPPSYYTTELTAHQMFDTSPGRNFDLVDETFNATRTAVSYTSPFTLTYNTTLSSGQLYYGIESTLIDKCSKMTSIFEDLSSHGNLNDKMSEGHINDVEKCVMPCYENEVVISNETKLLEMVVKVSNEQIVDESSGGNLKGGDNENKDLRGIFSEVSSTLKEIVEGGDMKKKREENNYEDVNVEVNSDLQLVVKVFDSDEIDGYEESSEESDLKMWPLPALREPDVRQMVGFNYMGEEKEVVAGDISSRFSLKMKEMVKGVPSIIGNVFICEPGGSEFGMYAHILERSRYEVKATTGNYQSGGVDLDTWKLFIKNFKGKNNNDTGIVLRGLRNACVRACRAISSLAQTSIDIDSILEDFDLHMTASETRFGKFSISASVKYMELIENCLMDASVEKNVSQDVILINGSTRTQKVKLVLQSFLNGKEQCKGINSDKVFAHNDVHASVSSSERNKMHRLWFQGKMLILIAVEMYNFEGISLKFLTSEKLLKEHPELKIKTVILSVLDPRRESSFRHDFILIGCSTGHLKVLQFMQGFLNRRVMCNNSNSNGVVTYDDVVQATVSCGKGSKVLRDVTSLSLGFQTARLVDEDEKTIIRSDKLLRRFELSNKSTALWGVPKINVCFDIDMNFMLNIYAMDKNMIISTSQVDCHATDDFKVGVSLNGYDIYRIRTLPAEQIETSNLKPIMVVIYEPEDINASFMLYDGNESIHVNILSCSKMNIITPTQKMSQLSAYGIEAEICFVISGPSTRGSSFSSARRNDWSLVNGRLVRHNVINEDAWYKSSIILVFDPGDFSCYHSLLQTSFSFILEDKDILRRRDFKGNLTPYFHFILKT